MITFHNSSEYIRPLEVVASGCRAVTHRALFSGNRHVFVKAYPAEAGRSLFNDVIGYIMAKHAGVTQPDAGIILLPRSLFDPSINLVDANGYVECFTSVACADLSGRVCGNLFAFLGSDYSNIKPILEKWPGFAKLVAFDTWVSNIDRNVGNLLYVGADQLIPIDHSDVLTGPNWQLSDLVALEDDWTTNRLIDEIWPWKELSGALRSAILASAERFDAAYANARVDLYELLSSNADHHRAHHYLWKRSSLSKSLLATRMSMLT